MNSSEQAFFYELQKQLPKGYYVFPKIRIADVIDAPEGFNLQRRKYFILPKHIDFTICDADFAPVVGIEVNGSSHDRPDRMARDERVKEIFEAADLPLEVVKVGTNFDEEIRRILAYLPQRQ